ncbi:MAG: tetratricopeptide repeat protein [Firmicutes bacterium]|nr:tetratricopeptide repeat protein [Bacillota bacterium]
MTRSAVQTNRHISVNQRPILNLNLRFFLVPGLLILLFYPPFLRGLFFAPDLLPTQMFTAAIFALWCFDKIIRRDLSIRFHHLDLAGLAFLAAYLLSLIDAVNMNAAVSEVLKILNYLLLYWVVANVVRHHQDMRLILKTLFFSSVGVAVVSLGAATGHIPFPGAFTGREIMGTFQYKNALAAYLVVNQVLALALSAAEASVPWRAAYSAGSFLLWLTVIGTLSRGGWLLVPVVLGLFLAGLPSTYRWRTGFHLALSLGVALATSRWFLPAVFGANPGRALQVLIIGFIVTLLGHLFYEALDAGWGRLALTPRARRYIGIGLMAYFILVASVYMIYAALDLPASAGILVPNRISDRLESIQRYDPSVSARFDFDLWALNIVKDYPLNGTGGGGWNALYHRYQPYLYWTTEVHNHFFQVWVEAGTLGLLAFLAIWILAGRAVYRYWRASPAEEDWLPVWGAAVAAAGLGLHSFIDFDLSLPAVGMVLWTLLALIRTGTIAAADRPRRARSLSNVPGLPRYLALALGGLTVAACLFVPSWCFFQAGQLGAQAAQAMVKNDLATAQTLYRQAHRLNPFNASYAGDLAQVCTVRGLQETNARWLVDAQEYARQAVSMEPYNLQLRLALLNVYILQGQIEQSVAQAEAALDINPLDVNSYVLVGRAYVSAARHYLADGQPAKAAAYIDQGRQLRSRLEKQGQGAPSTRLQHRLVKPPAPPALALVEGQLAYLAGNFTEAEGKLKQVAGHKDLQVEARLWLAATMRKLGRISEAEQIVRKLSDQNPNLETEFASLLRLP